MFRILSMEKKETLKNKKVKDLISSLSSTDEKVLLKTIKSLKIHGNETAIEPLVTLLTKTDSRAVINEITDLLNTIKFTAVPKEIARCLINEDYSKVTQHLMVSIWSSGLDYGSFMGEIATATIKGDLMEAVECITILENLNKPLDENEIMDALLVFQSYLVEVKDKTGPKDDIIKEIVQMLQLMNDSI